MGTRALAIIIWKFIIIQHFYSIEGSTAPTNTALIIWVNVASAVFSISTLSLGSAKNRPITVTDVQSDGRHATPDSLVQEHSREQMRATVNFGLWAALHASMRSRIYGLGTGWDCRLNDPSWPAS
eukprot:scaffold11153_cov125-Isochrysis_galbana.AAC.9